MAVFHFVAGGVPAKGSPAQPGSDTKTGGQKEEKQEAHSSTYQLIRKAFIPW